MKFPIVYLDEYHGERVVRVKYEMPDSATLQTFTYCGKPKDIKRYAELLIHYAEKLERELEQEKKEQYYMKVRNVKRRLYCTHLLWWYNFVLQATRDWGASSAKMICDQGHKIVVDLRWDD